MNPFVIFGVSLAYEAVTTLLPFAVLFLLLRKRQKRNGIVFPKWHIPAVLVFSLYVLGVFHFTGVGTIYDIKRYLFIPELINLIPFSNEIDVVAYGLNVVLFVPLGLLAPMIWEKMDKLTNIVGAGVLFTVLIEISQLINFRSTDIDDVILNVLGGVVGFGLFKLWDGLTKSKYRVNSPVTAELPLCIVAAFMGRFLLYNEMGLMSLIHGF